MNSSKKNILLLSQTDLINAGCLNLEKAINLTEQAIKLFATSKIIYPDKISQIFDEKTQCRINCLPATILTERVCGMKWVSVFPTNPQKFNLPNLTADILLSNIDTGYPISFMEGTLCSNIRTASVSAVAAKYLARKDSKTIGFVGAGEQAKFNFMAIKSVFPELDVCYVSSRTNNSENKFVEDMSSIYPDVSFIKCCSDYEKAVVNTDILVSAISGQSPIIQPSWIKPGLFYSHVGGWEDDYQVPLMANKIVCDNWESVKHRTQTISRLYQQGKLSDADIHCDIDKIVTQEKSARENSKEFIYFNSVGLSYVDVFIAYNFYETCKKKGLGTVFPMIEQNVFEYLNRSKK